MIKINGMKTLTFIMLCAFVLTVNIGVVFSQDQEVCPLSKGYWTTHPDAWHLPPDTPFCDGGPTYIEIMKTAPKNGNALLILFQQFIAFGLNAWGPIGSCVPPDEDDLATLVEALYGAEELFDKYLPTCVLEIPKNDPDRALALEYAEIFDKYNNGYMCPDLCKCPCWTEENLEFLTASSCAQSTDNEYVSVATVQNFTLTTSDSEFPECNVVDYNAMIGFALAINYTQFLDCREGLEMLIDEAELMCSAPW
jgi:hypothetical protein